MNGRIHYITCSACKTFVSFMLQGRTYQHFYIKRFIDFAVTDSVGMLFQRWVIRLENTRKVCFLLHGFAVIVRALYLVIRSSWSSKQFEWSSLQRFFRYAKTCNRSFRCRLALRRSFLNGIVSMSCHCTVSSSFPDLPLEDRTTLCTAREVH